MQRTLKLGTAAIAIVLATAAVGIIAYDRSQARTSTIVATVQANGAVETQNIRYRVNAAPQTVFHLGQKRNGCVLTHVLPPRAVCDIATAFPDVGLDGNVMFIGTTRASANDSLSAFRLGK